MVGRKSLWWITGIALVLLGVAGVWVVGGTLVAPANRTVGPPPEDLPFVTTTLVSDSGSRIATWYLPADSAHATVVLLHPIRSDRRTMLGRARLFHEAGYAVVLIDMQAHGESSGTHITVGYREAHDVRAAVEFARRTNPDHQIGVVGRSLGGAAALLALPLDIDALVLEAVYPTIEEAVSNRIAMRLGPLHHVLTPLLLLQLKPRLGLSPSDLRPIDPIARAPCPVLVMAGTHDRHTTQAETERLFSAAPEPKQLVLFEGATHQDLLRYDPARYEAEVLGFLDPLLRTPAHLPPAP